jgi:cytochrome b561
MVTQSMVPSVPGGYSLRQIVMHWIVFILVAFQFVMGDNMTKLFRAAHDGRPTYTSAIWAPIHMAVGILILVAMLARLALRRLDGVPAPPKQHPALEWLARAVHAGLYVDLIGAPIVGAIAYFFLPSFAGLHHLMARQILVVLFALHFAGAVWHRFVVRDGVMTRMVRPAD